MLNSLTKANFKVEVISTCITAANQLGLIATVDTFEKNNPSKHINFLIQKRLAVTI
jgi:hypothetical protein